MSRKKQRSKRHFRELELHRHLSQQYLRSAYLLVGGGTIVIILACISARFIHYHTFDKYFFGNIIVVSVNAAVFFLLRKKRPYLNGGDSPANVKKFFEESCAFARRCAQISGFCVFSFVLLLLYDYGVNDWIDSHTHGYFGRVLAWMGLLAISGVIGNATFALIVWLFKQRKA